MTQYDMMEMLRNGGVFKVNKFRMLDTKESILTYEGDASTDDEYDMPTRRRLLPAY